MTTWVLKLFIIFLIFALLSPAPWPVYNRALFHFWLRTGEMVESFRRLYVSASIKMKAKLWHDTNVCKAGALIGYRIVGVSFALGVEKGLRWGKCRLVKMFYLSRVRSVEQENIGGTVKPEKTRTRGALAPSNLNFIKRMSGLYQTREKLALYPSEATTIFRLLTASDFFDTTTPFFL